MKTELEEFRDDLAGSTADVWAVGAQLSAVWGSELLADLAEVIAWAFDQAQSMDNRATAEQALRLFLRQKPEAIEYLSPDREKDLVNAIADARMVYRDHLFKVQAQERAQGASGDTKKDLKKSRRGKRGRK